MLYGPQIVISLEKADGSGGEGILLFTGRNLVQNQATVQRGGGHMTSYTDLHAYIYGVQALGY